MNNWEKFEWPADCLEELKNLATDLSPASIENSRENKSRDDGPSTENNFKKIS
jgi:hypothetical protein